MKTKLFSVIFFFGMITTFAQSVNYNTKKNYIAKGYDVVAYFDNQAIEGDKAYTTIYDNVKFKFSSEDNLKAFKNDPKKYIPQYGGYCAYAVAVSSKKVDINPKTFEIRDGKLYLFYNSWGNNTLKSWKKNNVKGLQKKADKNWEAMNLDE
ncbi:YHS domain-containing (seleno)protein [uncultured Psychroserpens sp.]|uniref:YHS domain-containing (seleno)protein n=1 Tax=uncultured Psychroserpens sp. TaxID=255436 RepID=UPI0026030FCD|nr:YHS domain-containing (seleno)protein [uncultured Psychroserpens sp.]